MLVAFSKAGFLFWSKSGMFVVLTMMLIFSIIADTAIMSSGSSAFLSMFRDRTARAAPGDESAFESDDKGTARTPIAMETHFSSRHSGRGPGNADERGRCNCVVRMHTREYLLRHQLTRWKTLTNHGGVNLKPPNSSHGTAKGRNFPGYIADLCARP